MENKKRKGFTLPEVLVVVAILILLVGIAIPGYERLTQKSDVSDALHNLEMLASAQNKYFVANGAYTRNLSALETPLRSNGKSAAIITTNNFTYSASASSGSQASADKEKNCVFSESTKNDYVLAYNYKTHAGPICSGSYCSEISNVVSQGSIAELCGKEYSGIGCDIKDCPEGTHLDEEACECVCDLTCGTYAERDAEGCGCHCIGRADHIKTHENLFDCECPKNVTLDCKKAGKKYDAANCDCTDCDLTEEFCNTLKKVLDLSNCQCVEPGDPNQFCDKACPAGKILDERCECVCAETQKCGKHGFVFNQENCKCECDKNQICSEGYKFDEEKCGCVCDAGGETPVCTPYQNLTSNCTCQCVATQDDIDTCNTTENFKWDNKSCDCKCKIRDNNDCPSEAYVADTKACKCVLEGECSITDADCKEKYGVGYIVNQAECKCVQSSCLVHEECPPNVEWDYRLCKCSECTLTQEYCKEHGNRVLNEKTCECDSCSTLASECESHNQVLDAESCTCGCSAETEAACSQPDNRLEKNEDCKCYCDTPSKIPGKGHQTFNSDPAVCKWECNYDCILPWQKNEEQCSCECPLDADKCKEKNPNYLFRTSGEEVCECYCGLDDSKCKDKNSNYTFTNNTDCSCTCGLDTEQCQTSSGNPYYDVNNPTSCQCQCSSSLLAAEVSRRNNLISQTSTRTANMWESNLSGCQPRCPITGDDWCVSYKGAAWLAQTGGENCYCYQASCPAQTCYNNNGNGHWDYRNCQCVCDIDAGFCTSQGKVFDATSCSCKNDCDLDETKCKNQNPNYGFHYSPYADECNCYCTLNNSTCNKDHGKVLNNETDCQCVCNNTCTYPHQVRNDSTCACECDSLQCTDFWTKNNTTCECTVCNTTALSSHCSSLGRASVTTSGKCECGACNAQSCAGQAVQDTSASGDCGCHCSLTDSQCASQKGNSNWKANTALTTCDCYCDHSSVDSAVSAKRSSTGSNNWVADYGSTCGPVCPASVKESCDSQNKNFDANTCSCTTCKTACQYPGLTQHPENNCACTCDKTSCSGNWELNTTTCECSICNIESDCASQSRHYNASGCNCGECNAISCYGQATQNSSTCQCECNLTNGACASQHSNNTDWVANTAINKCTCQCNINDSTCAGRHGSNANWKAKTGDGSCECYCDRNAVDSAVSAKGGGWVADYGETCAPVCPSSVQTSCTQQGKGFDSTTCACTSCTGGACSDYWQRDPNNNCNCSICNLTDSQCASDHGGNTDWKRSGASGQCKCVCDLNNTTCANRHSGNSNWKANTTSCGCYCDTTALNTAVSAKGGGWVANTTTCLPECPSSVQQNCTAQGKGFDSTTCACTGCTGGACSDYWERDPNNNCKCSICNLTDSTCATDHSNNTNWKRSGANGQCKCACDTNSTCSGNWQLNTTSCECTTCPSSVQSGCSSAGRAFNSGDCACGNCNAQSCAGQAVQDTSTNGDCQCHCNLTDSQCATQKGNSNWKANTALTTCDCYCSKDNAYCANQHSGNSNWKINSSCTCSCDHSSVDSAVTAKRSSTGSNNWTADYSSICGPVCPSSVQTSCTNQGKGFDATNCKCTDCTGGACSNYWQRDPNNNCACSICNLTDSTCASDHSGNSNWIKNASTCSCVCNTTALNSAVAAKGGGWVANTTTCLPECPSSVQTNCTNQGKSFNSTSCTCGSCTGGACSNPSNTYWTRNPNTCNCTDCSLTNANCASYHSNNNKWKANTNTCSCYCDTSSTCSGNWQLNTTTCNCTTCPSSIQTGCSSSGRAFISGDCACGDCNAVSCAGQATQDTSTNGDCQCHCNLTDTLCASQKGNSNWKANTALTTCDCYCSIDNNNCASQHSGNTNWKVDSSCSCACDHSSVDSAVTAKRSSTGSNNWTADYGSTCGPVCPASVQSNCTAQGKGFDSTNCKCTDCTGGACSNYWQRDPNNNCSCSICNLTNSTCASDHSNNTNWKASTSTCSCYCDTTALAAAVAAKGGGWTGNTTTCLPECKASVQQNCTAQGKGFDATSCTCTGCTGGACSNPSNTYWTRNPETCNCTDCSLTNGNCASYHSSNNNWKANTTSCSCYCDTSSTCSGNWQLNTSTCLCTTCPSSVQTGCENGGRAFNSGTCACGNCNTISCVGQATQDTSANGDCQCHCNLTNDNCKTQHSGNANWKANTSLLVCGCYCGIENSDCATQHSGNTNWKVNDSCSCYCDHTAVDNAVAAQKSATGSNNWVADYSAGVCGPSCPASVETSCTNQGKGFDASSCKCTSCTSGCTYPHQVQNESTCACDSCDSLTCSGYWTKNSTTCECSNCNTSGLSTYCSGQNRVSNTSSGHCECGGCVTTACSGNWTRNQTTCECTECNLTDSQCINSNGADWRANTTSGNCSCYCAATANASYCSDTYGANYVANASGCGCHCNIDESYCRNLPGKYAFNSSTCSCDCLLLEDPDPCSYPKQLNTDTCLCTCGLSAGSCSYPRELNTESCSCECTLDNSSCSGDWIVDPEACSCTKCGLTDAACRSQHSNNMNYYADKDSCTCRCGLTSCPGEAHLNGCACECEIEDRYCMKMYGEGYVADTNTCSCVEEESNTATCIEPWVSDGTGGCVCGLNKGTCEAMGLVLSKAPGTCECVEPANSTLCQYPWVPMYTVETVTGCECGITQADCPSGTTLNSAACVCVQKNSSGLCNTGFLYVNGTCICGLTEEECQKTGKTLYTIGREVCECVPTNAVSCMYPWEITPEGDRCQCGLNSSDCAFPWVLNSTPTRCECVCGLLSNDSYCPAGYTMDPVTCRCVQTCNSIPQCTGFEIFNSNACRCECNIDSTYCRQAYNPPRYFNPANCTCSRYAL